MHQHDRWEQAGAPASGLPGKVLIAGVGFLVTAAVWALLAFIQNLEGNLTLTVINLALLAAHLVVGALVLMRVRYSWLAGLALIAAAIGGAIANDNYVAMLPETVTLVVLILSYSELTKATATRSGD